MNFSWLSSIQNYLIVGAVALAVGFGGGWLERGVHTKAKEVKVLKKELKDSANNIVQSHNISQKIETQIDQGRAASASIKSAVADRLIQQKEREHEAFSKQVARQLDKQDGSLPVCPDPRLDVGTVRLLNAARQGTAVDTTGSGDAALQAPTSVGIEKLIANDLDIVKMYHELATRHDELVDAVEQKLKDQAK